MGDLKTSVTTATIKSGRSSSILEQHVNIASTHLQSSSHRTSWSTQLHAQLGNFLASVVRSRSFYGTLADAICEEYPEERCWNGERVGEWVSFLFYLFNSIYSISPAYSPIQQYLCIYFNLISIRCIALEESFKIRFLKDYYF